MGSSPDLSRSHLDSQPMGELLSGKGQHGVGLLRSLAEGTLAGQPPPNTSQNLGDSSPLPIGRPGCPGEAPGAVVRALLWPPLWKRYAWRAFSHRLPHSVSCDYSQSLQKRWWQASDPNAGAPLPHCPTVPPLRHQNKNQQVYQITLRTTG